MFETHETARMEIHSALEGPGGSVWDYVYTRLHMHWFHVVAQGKRDADGYRELRNFFLPQIEGLLAVEESANWEITEASLVTPAHMNGSGHWKMEVLNEVLRGREPGLDHEQYAYVFVLCEGGRYTSSLIGSCATDLIDLTAIYQAGL